jgi:hypothetical protein
MTTFRDVSAITANSVSKAILRPALDEFLRKNVDVLNKELFYFPSFEFVTSYFVDPFGEDNRHLSREVPIRIVNFFVGHYCAGNLEQGNVTVPRNEGAKEFIMSENEQMHELISRIAELENNCVDLQRICDERQHVIDGLKQTTDERLGLIMELDKAIKRITR